MPPNPSIQSLAQECAEEINAITTTKEITDIIVAKLSPRFEELQTRLEKLALVAGIEQAEPNAGDDPTKNYWIGLDQVCYDSLDQAISQAIAKKKH